MLARSDVLMLLILAATDPARGVNELTTVQLMPVGDGAVLSWSDAEEILKGSLSHRFPVAGQPLSLSVQIVDRSGVPFDGPVTLSIRPLDGYGEAASTTVNPGGGARQAAFVPASAGEYRLEAAWRSSRYKVVRGRIVVAAAPMSQELRYGLGGGLTLLVTAIAAWLVRRSG